MPKKIPDLAPTQPSVPSPEFSSLSFSIETFDDLETGQPTQYGHFSRNWQDEEALDLLIDKLEASLVSTCPRSLSGHVSAKSKRKSKI